MSTEDVGGSASVGLAGAERDEPDLVAALVGVEQQREDRGLDLLHALARGHRAGGVDAEQDEVGLVALLDRDAQVVGAGTRCAAVPSAAALVRGGGADRLGQVDRAGADAGGARRRCGGRPASRRGTACRTRRLRCRATVNSLGR